MAKGSYNACPYCPLFGFTPNHICSCLSVLEKLHNIYKPHKPRLLLRSPKVDDIARAVLDALGQQLISQHCMERTTT
ncbi:hypothetical protein TNCV_3685211 [Trichonephila clavipes]|nr:hypothetical protein TNCV_1920611 [Trichonephila clavipes]GFV93298.1 hypothetical protein TNCV_3685211 [Trichonephila clavipes]